jgi:hypothetical protein
MRAWRQMAAVGAAVLVGGCAGIKVGQDYDVKTDFTSLKTYAWQSTVQAKTGDVRVDNTLLDDRIRKAVDDRLAQKGYRKTAGGIPDFRVAYSYQIRRKVGSEGVQTGIGVGVGGSGSFGGVGLGTGGGVNEYDEGTLVIDFLDAANGDLLWRGTGSRRLVETTDPEKATRRVNETVERILEQFPPPSKP